MIKYFILQDIVLKDVTIMALVYLHILVFVLLVGLAWIVIQVCTYMACIYIYYIILLPNDCFTYIASNVKFSQSSYSTAEDDGPLKPVLILNNSLTTNITIQVRDNNNTATGECTHYYNVLAILFE